MDAIVNCEKKINNKIFMDYFRHQNQSFLLKELHTKNYTNEMQILGIVHDAMIDLRNDNSKKNINKDQIKDQIR